MKIGIMTGSFNPPHLGHLQVLLLAREEMLLDQIWILPLSANPLKFFVPQCTVADKIMLCNDLFRGFDWLRVFDDHDSIPLRYADLFAPFVTYVSRIKVEYVDNPKVEFFVICGSDSFRRLLQLTSVLRILPPVVFSSLRTTLSNIKFIVSPRWGGSCEAVPDQIDIGWGYPKFAAISLRNVDRLKPYHQLSSRRIRASLLSGERNVHGLTPSAEDKILTCLRGA